MQKTIDITLNGTRFTLEERAYERLQAYINGLETHFAHNGEKTEILRDIESRIAEQFISNRKGTAEAVTDSEVSAVIQEIGSVSDLAEFDGERTEENESASASTAGPKKTLYRDIDNTVLGGVCSGLAAYVGMDITVMRILVTVLAIFFFPLPIIIYFILWLVVPAARTPIDKMKMRGEPVTVATIQTAREGQQSDTTDKTKDRLWGCLLAFIMIVLLGLIVFLGFFSMMRVVNF